MSCVIVNVEVKFAEVNVIYLKNEQTNNIKHLNS